MMNGIISNLSVGNVSMELQNSVKYAGSMPSVGATGFPVRYKVVGVAASLAALTYLDRVCISVLAPSITRNSILPRCR